MPIEVIEVCDDDGHRQRDGEHAGYDAQCPDQLTEHPDRCDVTVAYRRHGYDRPPEGARDGGELGLLLADLGVVGGRTEDHHGYQQEEEEHAELVETGLDGQTENAKTLQTNDRLQADSETISFYFVTR